MSNRKLDIIRPSLELVRLSDGDLLLRANAVYDGMIRNAAYPSPWVSMDAFKAAIDAFTAAVAATLDGGRQATVDRDACRADLTVTLRSLGHYVEIACGNDMATFVSSGFLPAIATLTGAPDGPSAMIGPVSLLRISIPGAAKAKTKLPARAIGLCFGWREFIGTSCRPRLQLPENSTL